MEDVVSLSSISNYRIATSFCTALFATWRGATLCGLIKKLRDDSAGSSGRVGISTRRNIRNGEPPYTTARR
jgi:hypothetical protein